MAFARAISKRSGTANRFNPETGPGKHWWSNFCKRHPWLTLHRSDKLDHSQVECLNPEVVGEYFELLEKVLAGRGLRNAPRQIYNCDETFSRQRKGCHPQEYQECIFSGCWYFTMLWAVSAAGFPLPPMIIYPNGFPANHILGITTVTFIHAPYTRYYYCYMYTWGTIFAYGQTLAGKTYTMTGKQEQPGIIPLTFNDIDQVKWW